MEKLIVQNTITINAPASKVWDALVNPEQTKKYMFGCETVSDWKTGSPLLWRMYYEGKEIIPVRGIILDIQPDKLLRYTVIDPNADYPDVAENYLKVTYVIEEQAGKSTLVVSQDGFEDAADGEKRYKDVYNNGEGWNQILLEIKKVVETD